MRLLVYILILTASISRAQYSPILSQYMFNDLALNPANTGNQEALSLFGNFRAQWVGIPGAPLTQTFSAHSPLRSTASAVGIQFVADQIGVSKSTGIFGSYAYGIDMKSAKLSFGLAGGITIIRANNANLNLNDPSDVELMDSPIGVIPDFSFGMNYKAENYFVSFSIPMFLGHKIEGNKIRIDHDIKNYNFMLGGGLSFDIGKEKKLKPSLLLKYNPSSRPQVDINLMAELHPIVEVGLSYRTEEAIIALVKVNPTKQFSIMYSFGMPVTPIGSKQFGSHELALRFNFLYKTQISNARYLGW